MKDLYKKKNKRIFKKKKNRRLVQLLNEHTIDKLIQIKVKQNLIIF